MTEQPPQRMRIDKGMLNSFQGREEEEDYDGVEIKKEDGGNEKGHAKLPVVQYTTTTTSKKKKHKKQKIYHNLNESSATNANHHGGGLSTMPEAVPSSIHVSKSTGHSLITTSVPGRSNIPLDMSLTEVKADHQKMLVKDCVRKRIFSIWKFYQREFDSQFSLDEETLCGFILKYTGLQGDEDWWVQIRKVVRKCHTDMRNNAIKNMQAKFKGKHETNYMYEFPVKTNSQHLLCSPSRRVRFQDRSSSTHFV
jgi:hypothetical protein